MSDLTLCQLIMQCGSNRETINASLSQFAHVLQPTISICLKDCLELSVMLDYLMGGKTKLCTRAEFKFYDDALSFDWVMSWEQSVEKRVKQTKASDQVHMTSYNDGIEFQRLAEMFSLRCQSRKRTRGLTRFFRVRRSGTRWCCKEKDILSCMDLACTSKRRMI